MATIINIKPFQYRFYMTPCCVIESACLRARMSQWVFPGWCPPLDHIIRFVRAVTPVDRLLLAVASVYVGVYVSRPPVVVRQSPLIPSAGFATSNSSTQKPISSLLLKVDVATRRTGGCGNGCDYCVWLGWDGARRIESRDDVNKCK